MPIAVPRYTLEDLETFPDDGNRYELLDGLLMVTPPPGDLALEEAVGLEPPEVIPVALRECPVPKVGQLGAFRSRLMRQKKHAPIRSYRPLVLHRVEQ